MLDLLQIFLRLLEVFVYTLLAVTSSVVVYAVLQCWFDARHAHHASHVGHPTHASRLSQ